MESSTMLPRIIIIDDEYAMRDTLSMLIEELGYKTVQFESLHDLKSLELPPCGDNETPADILMIDQNLSDGKGLDFIEQRIQSGVCRCGGKCMTIMSGGLTRQELEKAQTLGCSLLEKPIFFNDLEIWLSSLFS